MATKSDGIEIIDLTDDDVIELSPEREATPSQLTPQRPASPPAEADAGNAPQALPDPVAASQAQHSVNAPQGVELPEWLRWMREGRAAAAEATSPDDQTGKPCATQKRKPEPCMPLPSFGYTGWTAINAPANLGPGEAIGFLGLQSQRRAERRIAPARSPSVEFLQERRLPAATLLGEPVHARSGLLADNPSLKGHDASPCENLNTALPTVPTMQPLGRGRYDRAVIRATAERASARFGDTKGAVDDSEELVMYTDGSIRFGKYGGGAIAWQVGTVWAGRALAVGELFDSSVAEMSAIYGALRHVRKLLQPHQRRLAIITDSADCLTWLANGCNDHEWIAPVITEASELQRRFTEDGIKVRFQWVKAHAGTVGNEMADKLAGVASRESAKGVMMHWDVPDTVAYLQDRRSGGGAEGRPTKTSRRIAKLEMRLRLNQAQRELRAQESHYAELAAQSLGGVQASAPAASDQ